MTSNRAKLWVMQALKLLKYFLPVFGRHGLVLHPSAGLRPDRGTDKYTNRSSALRHVCRVEPCT